MINKSVMEYILDHFFNTETIFEDEVRFQFLLFLEKAIFFHNA